MSEELQVYILRTDEDPITGKAKFISNIRSEDGELAYDIVEYTLEEAVSEEARVSATTYERGAFMFLLMNPELHDFDVYEATGVVTE